MPPADLSLRRGDRLSLLGKAEDLRSLRMSLTLPESMELPTLRQFTEAQRGESADVYAFALPVEKDSQLRGRSIRESRLRERYDCMILGLQRQLLPILQPDVNMILQPADRIWVLGSRKTAERLLASSPAE